MSEERPNIPRRTKGIMLTLSDDDLKYATRFAHLDTTERDHLLKAKHHYRTLALYNTALLFGGTIGTLLLWTA